ncbi:hypothetical protein A5780_00480 [Nocardia sp. 852002-20019_SCH5090214]|uniref:DUF3068 domain-containing protein n=1 Tax=Nocardia nova TaxID=37330 RepID=A0A2S6AEN8_9NOCA|nr:MULTISPECIES: DUF3068 domain-containing protein [Nocardia]OBF86829.1 hypothetical protein A9X06_12045 [Mycobacterium sp. 852002-51759_SCH5129042]MBF6272677.1 DUF3068 domain-containing protein [Nocardia nova]MDN2500831.1 DUF3068 domain-containing protein [Nocardia nova]OBA52158.1 hypothetical protein A5789_26635 [Nocardia sp. 852002-51101_SCH5132738]OBA64989.1 hypothetical protein A5780_00480 [Nocardia sp. 852002-20019_SCH5090214]
MALSAGTKRTVACLLVGLGALLIVAAILVPTYGVSQLAKTPLDLEITTIASNKPDAPSEVLDSKTLLTGEGPAVVDKNVGLISQRFLTVEEPSGKTNMTIQAGQTLRRKDKTGDTGLLSAIIDRVTINRKTGQPIDDDPNGSIATTVDSKGNSVADPVQHTGLQYRFPLGTEKTTYPYFDINARKSFDMKFVEETEINDLKVYHFHQQVPATDLSKVTSSPTNRLTFPAAKWGVPGDGDITMNRYYTNTRDVYVEPQTGTVINGSEQLHQYYARSADKPEVTAINTTLTFDPDTIRSQIDEARKYMDQLSLYGRTLPIIFGVLGAISLIAGLILGLRGGDGTSKPGRLVKKPQTTPPSDKPGQAFSEAPTQQIDISKNR